MQIVKVTLEIPVKGKPAMPWNYEKQKAESVADVQAISRDVAATEPEDKRKQAAADYLVKAFNYGHDLLLRGDERSKGNRAAQGPEKEIEKGVTALVESGYAPDVARTMIIEQRKATGKPV